MKLKSIISTILLATTTLSYAGEGAVTITQPSGRNSATERWITITTPSLDRANQKYEYVVGNCATTVKAWEDAGDREPIVMVYTSTTPRETQLQNLPCTPSETSYKNAKIYVNARGAFWLCGSKKSKPMTADNVKVAFLYRLPFFDVIDEINSRNKYHWSGVPAKGSPDMLLMLANGDVDYAVVAEGAIRNKLAASGPGFTCSMSGRPVDQYPHITKSLNLKKDPTPILYWSTIVVAKNTTPEQDTMFRNIYNMRNPDFANTIGKDHDIQPLPKSGQEPKFIKKWISDVEQSGQLFKK